MTHAIACTPANLGELHLYATPEACVPLGETARFTNTQVRGEVPLGTQTDVGSASAAQPPGTEHESLTSGHQQAAHALRQSCCNHCCMTFDSERPIRARLRDGLRSALKARDRAAMEAIRSMLGVIDNAQAVPIPQWAPTTTDGRIAGALAGVGSADVPRRALSEDEIRELVVNEIDERRRLADEHDRISRPDDAQKLRAQASLLEAFLQPYAPG